MKTTFCAALAAALVMAGSVSPTGARATTLMPYSKEGAGVYNPITYVFKATHTGDVVAYFTGANAAYDSMIGLLDNGVSTGVFGLENHLAKIGSHIDLGRVKAGDTLVFVLEVFTLGKSVYSDPSMNLAFDGGPASGSVAGHNHIYSSAYDGTDPALSGVPSGTYVAFKDQPFPHSDYDYNDETFVFTNTTDLTNGGTLPPGGGVTIPPPGGTPGGGGGSTPPPNPGPGVPEPAAWALMLLGIGIAGVALRRREVRCDRRQAKVRGERADVGDVHDQSTLPVSMR